MLFATTPKTAFDPTGVLVCLPGAVAGGSPEERIRTAYTHHHHHHHWQNCHYFRPIAVRRRFCQIASGFHFFGFCNNYFFTEQDQQPCVQPPTWRTRSLYFCPSITGWSSYIPIHRVPFSSHSETRRATVEVF
jgi:hypothetical protein